MQNEFWNLVNEGVVEILCEPACIDALNDTPDMDLNKFIDEAIDMGWIIVNWR
tara:strand:+ start:215 stop:373 length:159 start_codon:yes stop_codon:yes gene_type:complete